MAAHRSMTAAAGSFSTSGPISDRSGSAETRMARFEINAPITTREPTVTVDAGLSIGRHRFRLEVIDAQRRTSSPHEAIVEVQRIVVDPLPTGPIGPVRPVVDPVWPVVLD